MEEVNIWLICFLVFFSIIFIISMLYLFGPYHTTEKIIPNQISDQNLPNDPIEMEDKITLYSIATDMKKEVYNHISSLKQYKHNYKVIGIGSKWTGFTFKIKNYMEACENHFKVYGEDSIIICVDSYDAFSCKNVDGLRELFLSFNARILGGVEDCPKIAPNYGNIDKWWEYKNLDRNRYKYTSCNSGFIMGYAKDIYLAYKWIYENNFKCDQLGFSAYVSKYPELINFDLDQKIIFNKAVIDNTTYNPNCYFKHYPGYISFCKFIFLSFDVECNFIKDKYSLIPFELSNSEINDLNFTAIFSGVGIVLTASLLILNNYYKK